MKVVELPNDNSVEEALTYIAERGDKIKGVMIISLNKDGSQYMVTSKMSTYERAFLTQFANATMLKWFDV